MEHLAPLLLTPLLVEKPWGGTRLRALGRAVPEGATTGESWDVVDLDPTCTDVPDPVSRVAHGPFAGATLHELVRDHGEALLGRVAPAPGGRFPLLLKHLDTAEPLSVQVHPPAAVCGSLPGAHHKTESWVVVDADPGAELVLGLRPGTTPEELEAVLGTPDVVPLLRRVPAVPGDVHHVPAGLVHAVGPGVLLAEPQTPSDTTYRLYDWAAELGRAPRTLHREEVLACLRDSWAVNLGEPAPAAGEGELLSTDHYTLTRTVAPVDGHVHVPQRLAPRVLVVLDGTLHHDQLPAPLARGAVVLLPAAWGGTFEVTEGSAWLDVDVR